MDQSGNVALTHGELPCPNCGYQRQGLALDRPCPECGARGFDGEVIVSGLPGVEPEWKRSGLIVRLSYALVMISLFLIPAIFGRNTTSSWSVIGMGIAFALAGVAAVYFALGFFRRRRERDANLSQERCSLEFRRDVVVVRQREVDREVPYRSIVRFDTKEDLPKRRTRVWLVTRDRLMHAATDEPIMVIVGTLEEQRAIATEMHARISSKRR